MSQSFITNLYIINSRNVKDLDIPLSSTQRQHLIITGKNGSGKTSLIHEIDAFLNQLSQLEILDHPDFEADILAEKYARLDFLSLKKHKLEGKYGNPPYNDDIDEINALAEHLTKYKSFDPSLISLYGGINLTFSDGRHHVNQKYQAGTYVVVIFDAKRTAQFSVPTSIQKIDLDKHKGRSERLNEYFLSYLLSLRAERAFASEEEQFDVVKKIDKWFANLEVRLKQIFDVETLRLEFNRSSYNFNIITNDSEPFSLTTLSDGYSSILSIIAEIILRMEANGVKEYDMEGIVIIDELETHLHVGLQKTILPFLTDFFPNIQFIITTHSPFVLTSLANATICDLQQRIVTNDLSTYSYDAIIESYFNADKYSEILKARLLELENLISLKENNPAQRERIKYLKEYFAHAPKFLSDELELKLHQITFIEMNKDNG